MTARSNKLVAAGVALAVAAASLPLAPAEAGHKGWGKHHHHHHYYHRDRTGAALALGIFGLATGLVVGSALSQQRYYYDYELAPGYYPGTAYAPEPWTPEWYAYCASKYKSFDMYSGMYRTYRGELRFCQ